MKTLEPKISSGRLGPLGLLKAFYFAYFVAFGSYSPYLNLYFEQRGLSGAQIGLLNTIIPLVAVVIPPVAGLIADRTSRRRLLLAGTILLSIPFFLLLGVLNSFPWVVALLFVFSALTSPVAPMADGITMEMLGKSAHRYGGIRVWGSIGYAVAVLGIGRFLESAGWSGVFGVYSTVGLLAGLIAMRLPERFERDERQGVGAAGMEGTPARGQERPWSTLRPLLTNWRLVSFLLIAFLGRASAAAYYNFFSIYLDNLGVRAGLIGFSWMIGVISEIGLVLVSNRVLERIGPEALYLIGLASTAVRWYLYSFVTAPAAILTTQLLHGLTFGAFQIAAVSIVNGQTPTGLKASGQSLLSAMTLGLAGVFGAFFSGQLYDRVGIRPLFALSSGVALLAATLFVVWIISRSRPARTGTFRASGLEIF